MGAAGLSVPFSSPPAFLFYPCGSCLGFLGGSCSAWQWLMPVCTQGVVLQQDSYIEDQKLLLSERVLARPVVRPSSLAEQEKQRSLEKQRQELAELQRQQAQHLDEQRRRERQWDMRERALQEREAQLVQREDELRRGQRDLERERDTLQQRRGVYQAELERLRVAQRQLEREQEQLRHDSERHGQVRGALGGQLEQGPHTLLSTALTHPSTLAGLPPTHQAAEDTILPAQF